MSSKDVFNFNMYFDSEDVYRRVQYGQHGERTGLFALSWNLYSPRERSVPYKLPDRETKRELEEVNIYVAEILR